MTPYTKTRTGKLPNGHTLDFYKARDSHGNSTECYSLRGSSGIQEGFWSSQQYVLGKPDDLQQLLKEVIWND